MKNIKFIFATLTAFAPIFAAVPAVLVVTAKVADAAYIRLESLETVSMDNVAVAAKDNNFIRLESWDVNSKRTPVAPAKRVAARMIRLESFDQVAAPVLTYGHSDFSNAFSPRVARAVNVTAPVRTASVVNSLNAATPTPVVRLAASVPSPVAAPKPAAAFQASILAALNENITEVNEPSESETVEIVSVSEPVQENPVQETDSFESENTVAEVTTEVAFNISNFSWGAIDGPEDYNIAFEYSSESQSAYNMAVFYFNQMPPADFTLNAKDAVKSTNKTPYAVVGIDYLNCYSNDAQTHKALLLSADSSCATEPSELDNSSMLPDESSNTIILPVQVIYNSGLDRDINETDYITIGLYSVDADGNVTASRHDTNKYHFIP